MDKQTQELTAAEQLAAIRTQRRELARQQIQDAAAEMAETGTINALGVGSLTANLGLLELTERDFAVMVDTLRKVPRLAARIEGVDQAGLYRAISQGEAELAALCAKHRAAEAAAAAKVARLRDQYHSISSAAETLAAIVDRYPGAVRLPNARL